MGRLRPGLKSFLEIMLGQQIAPGERSNPEPMRRRRSSPPNPFHKTLADGNSEATSVGSDIGDFRYYDDVRGELGFFVDHFTPHELGIITNPIDGDSNAHIMHSDAVHCYVETTEVFYGFLWEDDIWFLNGHSVIQNDFESHRQEEFGIGEDEFYDIWN